MNIPTDPIALDREPLLFGHDQDDTHRHADEEDPSATGRDTPRPAGPVLGRGTLIPNWQHGPQEDLLNVRPAQEPDRGEPEPECKPQEGRPCEPAAHVEQPDDPKDFQDEPGEYTGDGDQDAEQRESDGCHRSGFRRPSWAGSGTPRRAYRRPLYRDHPIDFQQSGMQWWAGLRNKQRHLTYHGTAFAVGVVFDLPQFVSRQAVYLVQTYDGVSPNVCFWGSVVVGICWWDWRTRRLWPPLSWVCHVPFVSLGTGLLLYGPPVGLLDDIREFALSLV